MTKKEVELQTRLRTYRTAFGVIIMLISIYSAFIGKTNLRAIDLTHGIKSENIPVGEIRNQISSVLFLGNPSSDRVKMAFSMCELENVPTLSGRKGEALFYADGLNMTEPEITIIPFVDIKTKQEFRNVINIIKPDPNNFF